MLDASVSKQCQVNGAWSSSLMLQMIWKVKKKLIEKMMHRCLVGIFLFLIRASPSSLIAGFVDGWRKKIDGSFFFLILILTQMLLLGNIRTG